MTHFQVDIKPIAGYESVVQEFYSNHGTWHAGDSGLDLFCVEDQVVEAGSYGNKIPLGISVAGYEVRSPVTGEEDELMVQEPKSLNLYPRSSTGSKTPLRMSNSVGVLDAGYRGPIMALVDNFSASDFIVRRGDRYFQLCTGTLEPFQFRLVDQLSETTRGEGGFGSTGQ